MTPSNLQLDENGDLLFSLGDVRALGEKSGNALAYVFDEASKLNRVGGDGLEEAAKN